jgi:hypothetical protein
MSYLALAHGPILFYTHKSKSDHDADCKSHKTTGMMGTTHHVSGTCLEIPGLHGGESAQHQLVS